MKKVAIDCRYLGMSGIGRFLEGILDNLDFSKNDYYLIGKEEKINKYQNCNYIYDESSPFSVKGILKSKYSSQINKMDYLFIPNFIIPFWVKIKTIITLHDVVFLDMPEVNKNFFETFEKKYLIKKSLNKAVHILTVSKFSLDRIVHYYPNVKNKISYYYQGIGANFINFNKTVEKQDYVVYVGNIKKHKGLKTLIEASNKIKMKTYIVGEANGFKNADLSIKIEDSPNLKFTGKVDDDKLVDLISKAKFLIQPSLYEGFGIPPLEALCVGTKPILSDIDVFKEVYSDFSVSFFEKGNSESLANIINTSSCEVVFDKTKVLKKFNYKNFSDAIEKMLK